MAEVAARVPRTLVVVLWLDEVEDTLACLDDLDGLRKDAFTVVLVDNGSRPERAAEMAARRPHRANVQAVRSETNLGFAGGNAFGLRQVDLAAFDFVLLLNNDTGFDGAALPELVAVAERTGADVAGPAIVYDEHPDIVWQADGTILRPWLHLRVPAMNRPYGMLTKGTREVDFVTGCVMLIRTDAVRAIGFLDEAYFYSVEDLDYCLRAKAAGKKIVFVPSAKVRHKVSRTAGGWTSRFAVRHNVWGKARLIRTHAAGLQRFAALAFHVGVVLPAKWWRTDDRSVRLLVEIYRAFRAGFDARELTP